MPEFHEIRLEDKVWVDELLRLHDARKTEYCFTTLFIWSESYGTRIARYHDWLLVRSIAPNHSQPTADYLFPAGQGNLQEALEAIRADAETLQLPWRLLGMSEQEVAQVQACFPGETWEAEPVRDSFDYLYHREDLLGLKGKKYQAKRNFISRFLRNEHWSYERIDSNDPERCQQQIQECVLLNRKWCLENGCRHNYSLQSEICAGRKALANFVPLQLKGGLLRLNGEPVAYTIGEPLNSDTFIVHIEKAFSTVEGAYPMINRSFVEAETEGFLYINREDDAGDEGLRKAKLSYHPAFLEEKYTAWKK